MFRRLLDSYRIGRLRLHGNTYDALQRNLSEATAQGKSNVPLNSETLTGSKLFENARLPMEASGSAAASDSAAGALEHSTAGQFFSALGNVLFYGGVGACAFFGYYHYAYNIDQLEHMVNETERPENQFFGSSLWVASLGWYIEKRKLIEAEMKKYADPPSDRLLPDLPPHARHIKTLVLDLDDLLIHSNWTRGRGWRTLKRPGAEEFIKDMSQYFELVIYTSQLPTYADPILDRLDPQRLVQYRLYRDSTRYVDGKHVRDLSKLNRDLRQVLLLTADSDAYALQPENAIKLEKWTTTKKEDTTLLDLLPFLEAVVRTNVPDVRDVVRSYEGQNIPTAFRERMARVQEAKIKRQQAGRGLLGGK